MIKLSELPKLTTTLLLDANLPMNGNMKQLPKTEDDEVKYEYTVTFSGITSDIAKQVAEIFSKGLPNFEESK